MSSNSASIPKNCFFLVSIAGERPRKIVFELATEKCPQTCLNFTSFCTAREGTKSYKNTQFHRIIPGFMVQGGDYQNGDGTGGEAFQGGHLLDESFDLLHDAPGVLSMANRGKNTAGSQFFITLAKAAHLDGKHVAFGKVIQGMDVVQDIAKVETDDRDRPVALQKVSIVDCGVEDLSHDSPLTSVSENTKKEKSSSDRRDRRHSHDQESLDQEQSSYQGSRDDIQQDESNGKTRRRSKDRKRRRRSHSDESLDDRDRGRESRRRKKHSQSRKHSKKKRSRRHYDSDDSDYSSEESDYSRSRSRRKDRKHRHKSSSKYDSSDESDYSRSRSRRKDRKHRHKASSKSDSSHESEYSRSRRRRSKHDKRHTHDSSSYDYSSDDSEYSRKRSKKDRKHKHKSSSKKKDRKEKYNDDVQELKTTAANTFGKYGIIRENDFMTSTKVKRSFERWMEEIKGVPQGANVPKWEISNYMKEYAEDFNTATLPHEKYYDYDKWEMDEYNKRKEEAKHKKGVLSDEIEYREEMMKKAEEKRRKEFELVKTMMSKDRIEEMKQQSRLRAELQNAYRIGDEQTRKRLQKRLEPEPK